MELLSPQSPWFPFVSIDPERLGGEPVFRNSRVPVRVLFEYLEAGQSIEEFMDDFEGITREQISGVLKTAAESPVHEIKAA
jgi:uncharacterized protein (DUF433 family)